MEIGGDSMPKRIEDYEFIIINEIGKDLNIVGENSS
jgi:hypothetical protein